MEADEPFSWGPFIVGLIAGLFVGAIAAFGAGLGAMALQIAAIGWLIGALPGLFMGWIGWRLRGRGGWGEGLIVAASVITLIGGICGGAFGGGLDFK